MLGCIYTPSPAIRSEAETDAHNDAQSSTHTAPERVLQTLTTLLAPLLQTLTTLLAPRSLHRSHRICFSAIHLFCQTAYELLAPRRAVRALLTLMQLYAMLQLAVALLYFHSLLSSGSLVALCLPTAWV